MELNPYLVGLLPFLMLLSPWVERFIPAWKPVVLGVVSLAAATIAAVFAPDLTAQMVPAQAIELFKSLAAGYTVARFAEPLSGKLTMSPKGLAVLVVCAIAWPIVVHAQPDAIDSAASDKWYWIQQGMSILYGVLARIWGPKK